MGVEKKKTVEVSSENNRMPVAISKGLLVQCQKKFDKKKKRLWCLDQNGQPQVTVICYNFRSSNCQHPPGMEKASAAKTPSSAMPKFTRDEFLQFMFSQLLTTSKRATPLHPEAGISDL